MKKYLSKLPKFSKKNLIPTAKGIARGAFLVNVLIALGVFVALNVVFKQITLRYDLTSNKQNSLSKETSEVLKSLNEDVTITIYSSNQTSYLKADFDKLLKEYKLRSSKIKVDYVDVTTDIIRVRKDNVRKDGLAVVHAGNLREEISSATETEITSALYKLKNPKKNMAVFFTGSGEKSSESKDPNSSIQGVTQVLKNNNYEVQVVNEVNSPTIPENTDVVFVLGPQRMLTQQAEDSLLAYVEEGGKLFVAVDPFATLEISKYGLERVFDKFGVSVDQGIVFEPKTNYQGQPPVFFTNNYGATQISEGLQGSVFLASAAIRKNDNISSDVEFSSVVNSSADAWLETTFSENATRYVKDGTEKGGPLNLAVTLSKKINDKFSARMVLFADSDFMLDGLVLSQGQQGGLSAPENIDLFVKSANWLVARENLYNISPKEKSEPKVTLNDQQKQYAMIGVLAVMPLGSLAIGYLVMRRRKGGK